MNWYGEIVLGKIDNSGESASFIPLDDTHVKFVHYPDCQQLVIWLPQPGREYGQLLLKNKAGKILEEYKVDDKLNGSIQVIWDTVVVQPGEYIIEIGWKGDCKHLIPLKKYKGKAPASKAKKEKPVKHDQLPIKYKDGFGNEIPQEDEILRGKVNKEIISAFSRRIEYDGTFRAGTIIYVDGDKRISFYHEMGGGNCMFYIDIPTSAQWEGSTGIPLKKRMETLRFIADTVKAQQAPNTTYDIKESSIGFYYK